MLRKGSSRTFFLSFFLSREEGFVGRKDARRFRHIFESRILLETTVLFVARSLSTRTSFQWDRANFYDITTKPRIARSRIGITLERAYRCNESDWIPSVSFFFFFFTFNLRGSIIEINNKKKTERCIERISDWILVENSFYPPPPPPPSG